MLVSKCTRNYKREALKTKTMWSSTIIQSGIESLEPSTFVFSCIAITPKTWSINDTIPKANWYFQFMIMGDFY
jgi:hypothetical protein